jgi:catalase
MTPATNWREIVSEGEAERFERYATELRDMQRARAGGRALHAKGFGVRAEVAVLPDLPEHARLGPFAAPRTFEAFARFSNGSGGRQADRKPDIRGLAVKLLGVTGKKLIPGLEDATTQDFLAIHTPSTPVRNADEFMALVRAAQKPALLLPRLIGALGFFRALQIVRGAVKQLSAPLDSLATTSFYSAVPIRWAAHAAKFAFVARAPRGGGKPGDFAAELAERLRSGPAEWDFRVQFFRDEATTPIEDSSIEWKESDAPWLTVARLTVPQQDCDSSEGKALAERIEAMSFDPWHALVELRPLGNMMRARNPAYRESTAERAATAEPKSSTAA